MCPGSIGKFSVPFIWEEFENKWLSYAINEIPQNFGR